MSDRSLFWPPAPDWQTARLTAPGLSVTAATGPWSAWLLSGPADRIATLAKPYLPRARLLSIAPDRALLVGHEIPDLQDGWHPLGLALSDLSDAHIRIDVTGPYALSLLQRGSASLALNPVPTSAALALAGVTVLTDPLPDDLRLYVDRPWAPHVWHWLSTATALSKDHP